MKLWKILLPVAVLALLFAVACESDGEEGETDLCEGVTCEADETCNPATGLCEGGTDLCADVTCDEGETCNPATGMCEGGGEEGGACENTADLAILDDENIDPNGRAKDCMLGPCGTTDPDCLADCVANGNEGASIVGTGLSAACSACYGATTVCAAMYCLSPCLADPNGTECLTCLGENCLGDFCACAGYTTSETCAAFAPAE